MVVSRGSWVLARMAQSGASRSSWDESKWVTKWQEVESDVKEFTRVENSEGMLDAKNRRMRGNKHEE